MTDPTSQLSGFRAGPSDAGGYWIRYIWYPVLAVRAVGLFSLAFGWDRDVRVRPWPTFGVQRRFNSQVGAWVYFCGLCFEVTTRCDPADIPEEEATVLLIHNQERNERLLALLEQAAELHLTTFLLGVCLSLVFAISFQVFLLVKRFS